MNEIITLIEATAIAGVGGTGLGGIVGALFKKDSKKQKKMVNRLEQKLNDLFCFKIIH